MEAEDLDEASNAKLVYSLQTNAISGEDGRPIFSIEPDNGVIRTNVCCLDRETTPDYRLQVVATDGGGLRGKLGRLRLARNSA